jgi:uncharacterized protein
VRHAVLLDTGPLVASLDRRDAHHAWAAEQFERLTAPLLTCEAVLTEACHLLRKLKHGHQQVMEMVVRGALLVPFRVGEEAARVADLLLRYANVPMSFADACRVRMAELYDGSRVLTVDSDFKVYRKHGRQAISLIMPGNA